ncbi:MAG TPA: NapC/NirT family cytochrome c [Candidatus Polarisedimenticolaceae bacterium]|nr:NapC/NirT family cytochrome c [Candidatus Polarisedimenticolaceae bacterium]
MREFIAAVTRNPVSLLGTAITTASALVFCGLFAIELTSRHENPYLGILSYMVLPGLFVVGLVLIPIGAARARKKARAAAARGEKFQDFPIIDLNVGRMRRIVLTFLVLTLANLVLLATATYKGVEYMDTTEFCGTVCHTVMHPEFTAYERSPHARVKCVECHIGPGANWFVRSKLSGAWQVVSVTFDLFPRPIPSPIENLRPARDTCEQCHWPAKFVGDKLQVRTRFQEDEANTETKTVLLMRVGGVEGRVAHGIHWHVDPSRTIRYLADPTREEIYDVELTEPDGTVKRYNSGEPPADREVRWREMDCVDCHNRPTHVYRKASTELDRALSDGRIDRELPFIRRQGRLVLEQDYASHAAAREAISAALASYYRENHPEIAAVKTDRIAQAANEIGNIYGWNVFPEMNVEWGTYPNHIGHEDSPGCFRCHDDLHETEDGEAISQDCETCHTLLALEEEDPEVLTMLQP